MIVADARMLEAAGVGAYLKQLLPRMIEVRPDLRFLLLGKGAELSRYGWSSAKNVRLSECSVAVYSLGEQMRLPLAVPRETTLFWAPHFDIPVLMPCKLLVTVHDVFHLAMPQFVSGFGKQAYARLMFAAVATRAAHVLTVSDFSRKELLRLTRVRAEKITVTKLGANPGWLRASENHPAPHPRPYLLYVGSVKPHKNLIRLLEAFGSLLAEIPHDLVLVGKREGFLTGEPRVAAAARELGDRVRFTGFLDDAMLQAHFSHATALVHPSLYEGFGLSPLEAMACGTPALVSQAASLPEVCGDAALYFDPEDPSAIADSVRRLVREPELAERLARKGKARAAQFSWDRTAEQTLAVIDRLLV